MQASISSCFPWINCLGDANIMAIGARLHTRQEATALVRPFLETPFSGDPRHMRRIAQVSRIEEVASWT